MILFVFEGQVKEPAVIASLSEWIGVDKQRVECVYGTHIYRLYSKLLPDDDLDVFATLQSLVLDNALDSYVRDDFGEIYLFFDYDAHVGMPCVDGSEVIGDDVICRMLEYFNDESDHGLLYLSYPMAEALQHYRDEATFLSLMAKCKGRNCLSRYGCADRGQCTSEPRYKEQVSKYAPQLAILSMVTQAKWAEIVLANLKKLNSLMTGSSEYPSCKYTQKEVFSRQQVFISQACPQVAVLSAFPLFLFDYLGVERTAIKIAERS